MNKGACVVCGKDNSLRRVSDGGILCGRHRKQFYNYGKILPRSIRDKNEIVDKEDHCEITLYSALGREVGIAFVDKKDKDLVSKYKWHLHHSGYVQTNVKQQGEYKRVRLHKLLLPEVRITDHINRNKLDNRRRNLRPITASGNIINRSSTKGVYYEKRLRKWKAVIGVKYRQIYLGLFSTEEEAKEARKTAEVAYYGSFSPQKDPQD